jgi:hypothetical protein
MTPKVARARVRVRAKAARVNIGSLEDRCVAEHLLRARELVWSLEQLQTLIERERTESAVEEVSRGQLRTRRAAAAWAFRELAAAEIPNDHQMGLIHWISENEFGPDSFSPDDLREIADRAYAEKWIGGAQRTAIDAYLTEIEP